MVQGRVPANSVGSKPARARVGTSAARSVRRIVCAEGCGVWFYYDGSKKPGKLRGGGRPPVRCPRCAADRADRLHAENRTNWHWKRAQLRLAEVA